MYLTVADAAEKLSVTSDKITDLIHSGQLPAVDVSLHRGGKARWRIDPADLDAFLAQRRTRPKPPRSQSKRKPGFERKYFV
jgi:excisionase family DNA binding protein